MSALVPLVALAIVGALLGWWLMRARAGRGAQRPRALETRRGSDGEIGGIPPGMLGFTTVADDAIVLPDGERCAVLALGSIAFDLLSEAEARAAVAAWAAFLNALDHPVQLLVWVTPANVAGYAARLAGQARRADSPLLASVNHEYAAYVRYLARASALLERRFYLVVPSWDEDDATAEDPATLAARLNARTAELLQTLDRCRLPGHRLDAGELVALLREGWQGELPGDEDGDAPDWHGDHLLARGAERIAPAADPALPGALAVNRPTAPTGAAGGAASGPVSGAGRPVFTTQRLGRR